MLRGRGAPGSAQPSLVSGAGPRECLSRSRVRKRAGGGELVPAAPHPVLLIGIGGGNVAGSRQSQRRSRVPEGPRCPVPFMQACKVTPWVTGAIEDNLGVLPCWNCSPKIRKGVYSFFSHSVLSCTPRKGRGSPRSRPQKPSPETRGSGLFCPECAGARWGPTPWGL